MFVTRQQEICLYYLKVYIFQPQSWKKECGMSYGILYPLLPILSNYSLDIGKGSHFKFAVWKVLDKCVNIHLPVSAIVSSPVPT